MTETTGSDPGMPADAAQPEMAAPPAAAAQPQVAWQAQPSGGGIPVPGAQGFFFASMWSRFAAYLVDGLIIAIIGSILSGIVGAVVGSTFVSQVITVAVSAAYFIPQWTGGARATLGQRMVGIQVGHAFDGQALTFEQAAIRWAVLGFPLGLIAGVASLVPLYGLLQFLLVITLFLTTLGSPVRQGLHDRLAASAVVRRPGSSSSIAVAIVIIFVALFIVLPLFVVLLLVAVGSGVEDILRQTGTQI